MKNGERPAGACLALTARGPQAPRQKCGRRPEYKCVSDQSRKAETRTRQMERKLKGVEALPAEQAQGLLGNELRGADVD